MICSKCGANLPDNTKFCITCGNQLQTPNQFSEFNSMQSENANNFNGMVNITNNHQNVVNQSTQPQISQTVQTNGNNTPLNFIMYIIAVILKPIQSFKEEEDKLCNTKTTIIFSLIIAGAMMIINLLRSMIEVVFVKSLDYSTYKYKTTIDFNQLKDLDYLTLIGKNILIYLTIIAAIALVYYLASLVAKKSVSFIKMMSISATSLIPYVVFGMVISPILGKIWTPLAIITMVFGCVYSLLIVINLINEYIKFDNVDYKIYFNLTCLSILVSAGYYAYIKILTSELTNQIGDYLDFLN